MSSEPTNLYAHFTSSDFFIAFWLRFLTMIRHNFEASSRSLMFLQKHVMKMMDLPPSEPKYRLQPTTELSSRARLMGTLVILARFV